MTIALLTHPDCLLHDMGANHPERSARLQAVEDQLIASGMINLLQHIDAPLATRACLARVHSEHHIAAMAPKTFSATIPGC